MSKDDKEFPVKLLKKLSPEFVDAINAMSDDEIKARILTCEGNLYEIAAAKENDEKLNAAKEIVKDLSKPYSESKASENAKIQFAIFTLESRGINLN
jgi:hypothetical protein